MIRRSEKSRRRQRFCCGREERQRKRKRISLGLSPSDQVEGCRIPPPRLFGGDDRTAAPLPRLEERGEAASTHWLRACIFGEEGD